MRATEPLGRRPFYAAHRYSPPASWKRDAGAWRLYAELRERSHYTPKILLACVRDFEASRALVWAYGTEHWPADSDDLVDAWTLDRDGHTYLVELRFDDSVRSPEDEGDCYSAEDVEAWRRDEWHFGYLRVSRQGEAGEGVAYLGGIEYGDYWPGDEAYQVWHLVDDMIAEVEADLLASSRDVSAELSPTLPDFVATVRRDVA